MSKSNPETEFYKAFQDWINMGHNEIHISMPYSGSSRAPTPDFLVTNDNTGEVVGIEIKGGEWSLPVGIYPQLKEMKNALAEANQKFVFVSTVPLSGTLAAKVAEADILHMQVANPQDAVGKVAKLFKVEEKG